MESNQINDTTNEEVLFELLTLICEISGYGTKFYRNKEGLLHRIHGPAVIHADGRIAWFKDGKRHREDGPALICCDGRRDYYINSKRLSKDRFIQWQKDNGIKPIE